MQANNSPVFPVTADPTLLSQASKAAEQLKDKVSDMSEAVVSKLDGGRQSAAIGLDNAAFNITDKAEAVSAFGHSTAEKLSSTAGYLRDHDMSAMMKDVQEVVKRNPGPSLVVAAVAGFLTARAFSRSE